MRGGKGQEMKRKKGCCCLILLFSISFFFLFLSSVQDYFVGRRKEKGGGGKKRRKCRLRADRASERGYLSARRDEELVFALRWGGRRRSGFFWDGGWGREMGEKADFVEGGGAQAWENASPFPFRSSSWVGGGG